jgi:hypothetical protein
MRRKIRNHEIRILKEEWKLVEQQNFRENKKYKYGVEKVI